VHRNTSLGIAASVVRSRYSSPSAGVPSASTAWMASRAPAERGGSERYFCWIHDISNVRPRTLSSLYGYARHIHTRAGAFRGAGVGDRVRPALSSAPPHGPPHLTRRCSRASGRLTSSVGWRVALENRSGRTLAEVAADARLRHGGLQLPMRSYYRFGGSGLKKKRGGAGSTTKDDYPLTVLKRAEGAACSEKKGETDLPHQFRDVVSRPVLLRLPFAPGVSTCSTRLRAQTGCSRNRAFPRLAWTGQATSFLRVASISWTRMPRSCRAEPFRHRYTVSRCAGAARRRLWDSGARAAHRHAEAWPRQALL
jgi:hypothetical protein